MVRQPLFLEGDVRIGTDFDCGYGVVLRDCQIGDNVRIWSYTVIEPKVIIGNNVLIRTHCDICQLTIIEDDVFIASGVMITNDKYPPRFDSELWQPVTIKKGARIGAGVKIGPGVTIGEGALIGLGAVVIKDVPNGEVWVGNPARKLK